MTAPLFPEDIKRYLNDNLKNLRIETFPSLTSTNLVLKELAMHNEPEGKIIIAESQTAGHGRFNRPFFSPSGSGIYMSILLRPAFEAKDSVLITTAAAVAAANAIETVTGQPAQIKWINDIWVGSRKVCGILAEAAISPEDARLDYVVLGIGINVFEPDGGFPGELSHIAAAVSSGIEKSRDIRARITACFLNGLMAYYPVLTERTFLPEYRRRSFILGKEITVLGSGGSLKATALSVDDDCNLVVRFADGTESALNSGEISVRLSE